jgi:hypothetical protein
LVDRAKVVKDCFEKFLLDSGQSTITLEGILKEKYEFKSKKQLGYYFGVVVPTTWGALLNNGYHGLKVEDVDEYLRRKFLTVSIPNEVTGDRVEFQRTISGLDKDEMRLFIDDCIVFCETELMWPMPEPEQQ